MGAAAATTATAHKIAIVFYTMVKKQVEYGASLRAQRDGFISRLPSAGTQVVPLEAAP